VLSSMIDPQQLKPGDHIYSWRQAYVYAHHGLFFVIFFFSFFSKLIIFLGFHPHTSTISSLYFLILQRDFETFHVVAFKLSFVRVFLCLLSSTSSPNSYFFSFGLARLVTTVRFSFIFIVLCCIGNL